MLSEHTQQHFVLTFSNIFEGEKLGHSDIELLHKLYPHGRYLRTNYCNPHKIALVKQLLEILSKKY